MATAIPIAADSSKRLGVFAHGSKSSMRLLGQVILGSLSKAKREKEAGLSGRNRLGRRIGLQVPEFTAATAGQAGPVSGMAYAVVLTSVSWIIACTLPKVAIPERFRSSTVSRDRSGRYCP